MNEIKYTHDAYIEENGFVRARTFAHVTDNGVYLGKMEIMNRLIQPDEDYSNEAKKIIRACDSQFVPTVKALHLANKDFEAATQSLQQAEVDCKADSKAANKTVRGKAKTAATAAKTASDKAQAASDAFEAKG